MFKVLIVDDEPFVRKGLAVLINWEQHGFAICGEAENGKKAVAKIEQLKPDVVITDVRMPEMDGLELIKHQVEDLKSNTKFIILSGYDDFKYAQTAIKYGVRQYILKPIEQEELISILNNLHSELTEEMHRKEAYNEELSRYTRAIANDTFNIIIKGDKSPETLERARGLFGFDTVDRFRYVLIKDFTGSQLINLDKAIEPELYNAVFRVSENSYGVLLSTKTLNGRKLKDFVLSLNKSLMQAGEMNHLILVGKEIDDISLLDESYKSIQFLESYRFYNPTEKIIYYDDIENTSFRTKIEALLFDIKLLEAMETGQYEKINAIIGEVYQYSVSHMIEPGIINSMFNDFKYKVRTVVLQMKGNPDKIDTFYSSKDFDYTKINITDFCSNVLNFCISCAGYMNELQKSQSRGVLQLVEEFLKNKYNDQNLNLKNTARHFYINPLYLGQLFKQTYNIRFNDYLHTLRIEEAKTLLRRTDLKIYEIAEKVGYKDADYFACKFESIEQITPSQYRKKLFYDEGKLR